MSFPPGTEMFQFPGFAPFRVTLRSGFPIQKSTDQSLFAAPRNLSQRITSFIACACQGIHQMPLRHLIVLIANAYPFQAVSVPCPSRLRANNTEPSACNPKIPHERTPEPPFKERTNTLKTVLAI